MTETARHDVIILGAGFAGSVLGSVLSRNGADVLLIDAGTHPKFAIGESMIPYTLLTLRTIANRYDVPEIKVLTSYDTCNDQINNSFGWKRHFGFMHHRVGEEPDPFEATQSNTPGILNKSGHLYRQDTDSWLFGVALKYGCTAQLNCRVTDVDVASDGVVVKSADGREFRGRYLVDASGFRSPLADKLDLRERPSRFKHHSRSIFTHMINVRTTDEVLRHSKAERPRVPWHDGTMHHLFERGWFWVIPFNNNPRSRNPLVSVGVTMDPRRYPKPDAEKLSAGEEFMAFAERYPAVARQFADASPVREWISTDRLQYSSTASIGDRWCLMSHAAGFLDPLFSRGLSNTAEVINALAWRLLAALRDGDFSEARFKYVERLEQGLLDYNDDLVNSAYVSFDHFPLWNAVFRIWAGGSFLGAFRLQQALSRYQRSGDDRWFRQLEEAEHTGLWWPDHEEYAGLFEAMVTQCEAVDRGTVTPQRAAGQLNTLVRAADYMLPPIGFTDPDTHFLRPTPPRIARTARWMLTKAPADVRELGLGLFADIGRNALRGRRVF